MAKYAHINENGYVTNIVTIEEKIFTDENGQINDELAIRYLKNNHGGTWCLCEEPNYLETELSVREVYERVYLNERKLMSFQVVDDSEYIVSGSNGSKDIRELVNIEHMIKAQSFDDLDSYLNSFPEGFFDDNLTSRICTNPGKFTVIGDIYDEVTKTFSDGRPGERYNWNWRTEQWEEEIDMSVPDDILNDIDNYEYNFTTNQWERINI